MADLVLTPANVLPSAAATQVSGTAGVAIDAGQPVFQDFNDLDSGGRAKWKLADANAASPADVLRGADGIAVNTAAAGQPLSVALADPEFTHGLAGVTKGDILILSATPGGIAPADDLASGMRPCVLLLATSATQAVLKIAASPVAK